jgi:hypothetical protein
VPELVESKAIKNSLASKKDIGLAEEAGWVADPFNNASSVGDEIFHYFVRYSEAEK